MKASARYHSHIRIPYDQWLLRSRHHEAQSSQVYRQITQVAKQTKGTRLAQGIAVRILTTGLPVGVTKMTYFCKVFLYNIISHLSSIQLSVESCTDHWHDIIHTAKPVLVGQQIPAKISPHSEKIT